MRPSLEDRIKCCTQPRTPSVRSVRATCLRFYQKRKVTETSNFVEAQNWTRVTSGANLKSFAHVFVMLII